VSYEQRKEKKIINKYYKNEYQLCEAVNERLDGLFRVSVFFHDFVEQGVEFHQFLEFTIQFSEMN
jgi:hypothetical protein